MKCIPLRNAGLRVMDHSRLAFTMDRARPSQFFCLLRDRTETSKGRQTLSRRLGMAERARQRGASAEDYRGGALVRARDSRSAIHLRRPDNCRKQVRGLMPHSTFVSSCGLKIRRRWIVMGRIRFIRRPRRKFFFPFRRKSCSTTSRQNKLTSSIL